MRISLMFAGILAATILATTAAWACSCVEWQSPEDQLELVPLVFVGRAIRTTGELGADGPGYEVTTFAVERTLKGRHMPQRRIAHFDGGSGSICGIGFTAGRTYTVLVIPDQGRLKTSMCHRPLFSVRAYERALAGHR